MFLTSLLLPFLDTYDAAIIEGSPLNPRHIYIAKTNWAREALTEQKKLSARFFRDLFETFTIFGGKEKTTRRLKDLRRQTSEAHDKPGRYYDPETRRKANFHQYVFGHDPFFSLLITARLVIFPTSLVMRYA